MFGLLRFVARVALAVPFIRLGWDAAQEPGNRTKAAASVGLPNPDLAVRLNGYTMAGAGAALALGILPRLAAAALVGCLVPTTYAGHPFWKEEDPQKRNAQLINFLKNVSMTGGLLLVALRPKS